MNNKPVFPFAEWLREELKVTGMTQATLADLSDVTAANISRYARGIVEPNMYTLSRIIHAFGLELKAE